MWVVVDAGLASMSELAEKWTLEDYLEACEYLAAKSATEARMLESAGTKR